MTYLALARDACPRIRRRYEINGIYEKSRGAWVSGPPHGILKYEKSPELVVDTATASTAEWDISFFSSAFPDENIGHDLEVTRLFAAAEPALLGVVATSDEGELVRGERP